MRPIHSLTILFLLSIFIFSYGKTDQDTQLEWKQKINNILNATLTRYHYINQEVDDNFSKRVFELFLNQVDPNKHFFTQEQIVELSAYEYKIDNDVRNGTFYFYDLCYLRLQEQIKFTSSIYNTILKDPISLEEKNLFETNFDRKEYVRNNSELTKLWKITSQYQVAQNYITLYKEKYPSKNELEILPELELAARLKTKKDLDRRFKRLLKKEEKEFFTAYLDSMTSGFGPHTSYLPPEEKEDFDINMSGQLEGIGAVLREDDGYIKVVRIIPGSASWREGSLKAEDIILKVSEGKNGEAISIVETPVRDAVKLIRGPKGTSLKLTIKKPDGIIEVITLQRDIVVIKSTYAKTGIFKLKNEPFGYINLPSFYRDFDNNSNRNASMDIKKALKNLSDTNGLILDLRNNGGGSLKDAVDISGFFIPNGPIVQVSDNMNSKNTLFDRDKNTYYSKPLIILVNTFSASASEIVSAALQDYKRAIIIGSEQTFGKGTVQKVVNLDQPIFKSPLPLGYTKITIQEYFRINGKSTQFNGVTPDIIYPSQIDYLEAGEKELDYAFKGSQTSSRKYNHWKPKYNTENIIGKSNTRLKNSHIYKAFKEFNSYMDQKQLDSKKSIAVSDLWNNIKEIKEKNDEIEKLEFSPYFSEFKTIIPNPKEITDTTEKEELEKWEKTFAKDYLLNEALLVLKDMSDESSNN